MLAKKVERTKGSSPLVSGQLDLTLGSDNNNNNRDRGANFSGPLCPSVFDIRPNECLALRLATYQLLDLPVSLHDHVRCWPSLQLKSAVLFSEMSSWAISIDGQLGSFVALAGLSVGVWRARPMKSKQAGLLVFCIFALHHASLANIPANIRRRSSFARMSEHKVSRSDEHP